MRHKHLVQPAFERRLFAIGRVREIRTEPTAIELQLLLVGMAPGEESQKLRAGDYFRQLRGRLRVGRPRRRR